MRFTLSPSIQQWLLVAVGVAFFVPPFYSHAQAPVALGVEVTPAIIELALDPGARESGVLTLRNVTQQTETYYISARNMETVTEAGVPQFADDTTAPSADTLAGWIEYSRTEAVLGPGERTTIDYSVTVPLDATPGSHFAGMFVTRTPDRLSDTGAGVGFHVASRMSLRVSGDVEELVRFREFSTPQKVYTATSVPFLVRMENAGSVLEKPTGFITIIDMLGNEVAQLQVNADEAAIVPGIARSYEALWNIEGFAIGHYTAAVSMVFGETSRKTITREVSFWVVPVKEVSMVLGVLVLLILVFVTGVRLYVRSVLKGAGHSSKAQAVAKEQVSFMRRLVRMCGWLIALLLLLAMSVIIFFA